MILVYAEVKRSIKNMYIEKIKSPADLKKLDLKELQVVADERLSDHRRGLERDVLWHLKVDFCGK